MSARMALKTPIAFLPGAVLSRSSMPSSSLSPLSFDSSELSSAGFVPNPPNEKPPAPMPVVAVASVFLGTPNVMPPERVVLLLSPSLFFSVDAPPKPPKEKPPAPMPVELFAALSEDEVNPPPKEKPPAPILPDAVAGFSVEAPDEALPSSPGLGVSQAAHVVTDGLFDTMHTPHFQQPSSDALNIEPQPSAVTSPSFVVFTSDSSSLKLSSSSLSPSPNNHSIYQSTKASFVMTFSPDSNELIFLIVRRCSSSQYTEPNSSISLFKSDASIFAEP